MKTLLQTLAAASALAAAAPAFADPMGHRPPHHIYEFNAIAPRAIPQDGALRALPAPGPDESHDTATGGPVGGLGS